MSSAPARKIVVFSGGSAANSLVDVFNEVIERNSCCLSYVIPISDNGGSSSELIRVFGGPGIGDIRSMKSFDLISMVCVRSHSWFCNCLRFSNNATPFISQANRESLSFPC